MENAELVKEATCSDNPTHYQGSYNTLRYQYFARKSYPYCACTSRYNAHLLVCNFDR